MKVVNTRININKKAVMAWLGKNPDSPAGRVEGLIDDEISFSYALLEPKAIYEERVILEKKDDRVVLEDYIIRSRDVASLLDGCDKVSLMIATIGKDLEEQAKTYLDDGETARAAILDMIGSVAVEDLADKINSIIEDNAILAGYELTRRYSIGYGDWEIGGQPKLVKTIKGGKIGVSVSESNIMTPRKTITAIIGWKR